MSWNDKSKYEINKAVAKSYLPADCCFFFNKPDQQVLVEYGEEDGEALWEEFDPCIDIKYAWPIMKQYDISVIFPDRGMSGAANSSHIVKPFIDKEEALRCAMIVYLESEGVACEDV